MIFKKISKTVWKVDILGFSSIGTWDELNNLINNFSKVAKL